MFKQRGLAIGKSQWRIAYIPSGEEFKLKGNLLALAGALVFIFGLAVFVTKGKILPEAYQIYFKDFKIVLFIAIGGWVLGLISVWQQGKRKRKAWARVDAKCLDKEWRQVEGNSWAFRLLCEFYLNGKKYRVTPSSYWTTFITEISLKEFLDKNIAIDGHCELYVNPQNPIQTEFVGQDIKDKLLH